ncbi:uncharacterized protein LOC126822670 isoform X2 [Patella vulgata]|nr:uncharacterized protein LOC126822670 isoform X2 [Patella vulgata]
MEDNDDLGDDVNDMEVKSCSTSESDFPITDMAASKEEDIQIDSKENKDNMNDESDGKPLVRKAKKYTKKLPATDTKLIESGVVEKTSVKNSDKADPYDFGSQDLSLESPKKTKVETVQTKSKLKTKFPQIVTTPEKDPQLSTLDINKEIPELIITNCEKTDNNFVSAKTDNENSDSPDSSTPNLVKSKTRLRCPRLSTIFNHSVNTSLPSASFVNKPKVVSPAETIPYKANVITSAETIPVNLKDKSSETVSPSKDIVNNKDTVKQMRKTRSIKSRGVNFDTNSSVNEFQETDVLPKISLPKERNKRKQPESKSVATKPRAKSRKVTKTNNYDIFKASTSEKKAERSILDLLNNSKAERSILDLLNNSKSAIVKAVKPSDIKSSSTKAAADFDILLIEELSDLPKVKDEKNLDLRREVLEIEDVSDLNRDHIKMLVLSSESYLRDIFQGKVVCERHQDYKKGGMDRNNLNYQVHLELFTDEQHDVVMETLMEMFCKKHHKYMDYLLKVLLPEVLVKIYMEVKGTTHQETERIMKSPHRFEK